MNSCATVWHSQCNLHEISSLLVISNLALHHILSILFCTHFTIHSLSNLSTHYLISLGTSFIECVESLECGKARERVSELPQDTRRTTYYYPPIIMGIFAVVMSLLRFVSSYQPFTAEITTSQSNVLLLLQEKAADCRRVYHPTIRNVGQSALHTGAFLCIFLRHLFIIFRSLSQ